MRQPDNLPAFCRVHRSGRPLIGARSGRSAEAWCPRALVTQGSGPWPVLRISGWRLWGEAVTAAEAELPSGTLPVLMQGDRMLVSLGSAAVEFLEVLAGQALVWEPGRAVWPVQRESTPMGALPVKGRAGLAW